MNEKTNFYVFERKEIFLITILVILVAITSFLFGLKIGSSYSFDSVGNTSSDKMMITTKAHGVDLESDEEERVAKIVHSQESQSDKKVDLNQQIQESLKKKMLEEFSDEDKKFNKGVNDKKVMMPAKAEVMKKEVMMTESTESRDKKTEDDSLTPSDNYSGKYTIQLASYQTLGDAKGFAEGFKILGFNPIVNEVELAGKGNWFRVSLGVFENITKAKEFVLSNKSVFAERDYVFIQFD